MTYATDSGRRHRATKVTVLALVLLLVALAVMVGAALGVRWNAWAVRDAFSAIRWGVYLAGVAGLVALWGCIRAIAANAARGIALGTAALVLALVMVLAPYLSWKKLRASPRLNDITTDMVDPPTFTKVAELRKQAGARVGLVYTPEMAAMQRRYYPDIRPALLPMPANRAFRAALGVVRHMGWTVVSNEPASGRIEAYTTSLWFGFVDDMVIRVTPRGAQSRVDIRSVARIGRRDAGVNATRVRRFLRALEHDAK